jgi:hypothetical protein
VFCFALDVLQIDRQILHRDLNYAHIEIEPKVLKLDISAVVKVLLQLDVFRMAGACSFSVSPKIFAVLRSG